MHVMVRDAEASAPPFNPAIGRSMRDFVAPGEMVEACP